MNWIKKQLLKIVRWIKKWIIEKLIYYGFLLTVWGLLQLFWDNLKEDIPLFVVVAINATVEKKEQTKESSKKNGKKKKFAKLNSKKKKNNKKVGNIDDAKLKAKACLFVKKTLKSTINASKICMESKFYDLDSKEKTKEIFIRLESKKSIKEEPLSTVWIVQIVDKKSIKLLGKLEDISLPITIYKKRGWNSLKVSKNKKDELLKFDRDKYRGVVK